MASSSSHSHGALGYFHLIISYLAHDLIQISTNADEVQLQALSRNVQVAAEPARAAAAEYDAVTTPLGAVRAQLDASAWIPNDFCVLGGSTDQCGETSAAGTIPSPPDKLTEASICSDTH